jgi:diamine N-acetyltransferase
MRFRSHDTDSQQPWPSALRGNHVRVDHADFMRSVEEPFMQQQAKTGNAIGRDSIVTLREINSGNARMVMMLDVADSQHRLVAPNAVSIGQAHFAPEAWMRAVYADEMPVGFIMLSDPTLLSAEAPATNVEIYVWRFMIDHRYQSLGFGAKAFQLALDHAKSRPSVKSIALSFVPDEKGAEGFYTRFGFARTGEVDEGEVVMQLRLP